jgi:hypothetical protein
MSSRENSGSAFNVSPAFHDNTAPKGGDCHVELAALLAMTVKRGAAYLPVFFPATTIVIPAQAGIHCTQKIQNQIISIALFNPRQQAKWIPACAGMTRTL